MGDHAVELGAVVVDQADVFNHDVVDLPLSVDETGLVKNSKLLAFLRDNAALDVGIASV